MKKTVLLFTLIISSVALADDFPILKVENRGINSTADMTDYTFMEVHVMDHGETANEKFFVGPLPEIGQAVEMVYIGSRKDGSMRFQLRTKPGHQ